MKEKKNCTKKSWIQNGIIILVAGILYATGLHTEVIGFAQRGLLATGFMNPDVEIFKENDDLNTLKLTKADFNLNLVDSDGQISSLQDLKGKVIFLNFWATWCAPCIAEMPSINKLHKEMGDEIVFVLLSFDDDFEKAKAFIKRKDYNLPIYTLGSGLPATFNSSALPTTYIIDKKGNIVLTHKTMADYNTKEFKKFLDNLK